MIDLIRQHGADRVLLATDYPSTTDPVLQIKWWKDFLLPAEEKRLIFRENARRLLGL